MLAPVSRFTLPARTQRNSMPVHRGIFSCVISKLIRANSRPLRLNLFGVRPPNNAGSGSPLFPRVYLRHAKSDRRTKSRGKLAEYVVQP